MSIPSTTSQWSIESFDGKGRFKLQHGIPLPKLGPNEVLLKVYAVSLNARDSQIAADKYIRKISFPIIPASDCAGKVINVGSSVKRFHIGSRCAATFHRNWLSGRLNSPSQLSGIGATEDGVLRQYIVLREDELVELPSSLSFIEGSALPCAAVTAWHSLFAGSRSLKPGDVVLVQGSGGVSLFACQFARATGATVIATTGKLGGEREESWKKLGASAVLSYRDETWGAQVQDASGGRGADFILEVAGSADQSANALAFNGQIAVIGGLHAAAQSSYDMKITLGEVRRIFVGSRDELEEVCRAIEANGIRPVVDAKTWRFDEAREAYDHFASGSMWGKVVIQVAEE